jgi:hypothetical protein
MSAAGCRPVGVSELRHLMQQVVFVAQATEQVTAADVRLRLQNGPGGPRSMLG